MRAVIIGLDGMPYRLIADLAERGVMPNMRALIAEGAFREMDSSIPEVSSVAWSSIITGKNPGEHGIFGFTDLSPGSYRLTFPSFADLKAAPFWEREGSGRAAIINVPSTYPATARAMNGVLISGFVALKLEKAVYPPSLAPELERLDYRLDVDSGLAHRSLELFLEDLQRTLASHIAACRWLWEKEEWETFMIVFTTTDRLAHFLWEAYEDEGHPYHSAFLAHLRKIDQAIGELAAGLDRERSLGRPLGPRLRAPGRGGPCQPHPERGGLPRARRSPFRPGPRGHLLEDQGLRPRSREDLYQPEGPLPPRERRAEG
jgi:predicted AlkP superfamily phosphohydrolase/phosphomutase